MYPNRNCNVINVCLSLFLSQVSVCSPGRPGAHYVHQAGLKPIGLLSAAGIVFVEHHVQPSKLQHS